MGESVFFGWLEDRLGWARPRPSHQSLQGHLALPRSPARAVPLRRFPRPSGRGTLRIQAVLVLRKALDLAHTPVLPDGDLPLD